MEVFDCRDPPEYVYFAFYETKSLSQNVAGQECIPFAQVGFDKEVVSFALVLPTLNDMLNTPCL